jgi:hypothetical protein
MPDAINNPKCNVSLNYELLGYDPQSPSTTLPVTIDV